MPVDDDGQPVFTRAAGGIVWRETARGREVLLVHREGYDDWTLPKGKVEAGEEFADAAIREVHEETGYRASPTQFADTVFYEVDGRPKVVVFWHMALVTSEPVAEPEHRPDWFTVEEAVERLTYAQHRELLERAAVEAVVAPEQVTDARPPRWAGLYRRRLFGSLQARSQELLQTAAMARARRDTDDSWVTPALRLLSNAAEAARHAHRQDEGWRCLHAAQRLAVFGYDDAQVAAEATRLRTEAESKLRGWRRNAVLSILDETKDGTTAGNRQRLNLALSVLDEHSGNEHHRNSLVLHHLTAQATVLLGALAVVVGLLAGDRLTVDQAIEPSGWIVVAVAAAGAAGGAMSNLQRTGSAQARGRVPEQSLSLALAAVRPLVGSFAAVVVYALLAIGILQFEDPRTGTAIGLAFAAGFTERVFTGAIGTLTGERSGPSGSTDSAEQDQAAKARHNSA